MPYFCWLISKSEHPPSEINLGLKFEVHEKTLCRSILGPFSYTVGVSHFLFPGRINRFCNSEKKWHRTQHCAQGLCTFLYFSIKSINFGFLNYYHVLVDQWIARLPRGRPGYDSRPGTISFFKFFLESTE